MKKKLSLDKELVTSAEQIVVDLDGGTGSLSVGGSCQITWCLACFPTEDTCSVLED